MPITINQVEWKLILISQNAFQALLFALAQFNFNSLSYFVSTLANKLRIERWEYIGTIEFFFASDQLTLSSPQKYFHRL